MGTITHWSRLLTTCGIGISRLGRSWSLKAIPGSHVEKCRNPSRLCCWFRNFSRSIYIFARTLYLLASPPQFKHTLRTTRIPQHDISTITSRLHIPHSIVHLLTLRHRHHKVLQHITAARQRATMINHQSHGTVTFNEKIVAEEYSEGENPVVKSSKVVYDVSSVNSMPGSGY